jgi:hypothetical protein
MKKVFNSQKYKFNQMKQSLLDLIAEGKLKEALDTMRKVEHTQNSDFKDDLINYLSRFNRNQKAQHSGVISLENYQLEHNKIENSVQELLDSEFDENAVPATFKIYHQGAAKPYHAPPKTDKINILMLTALPAGTTELDLNKEMARIGEKLQEKPTDFTVVVQRGVNQDEFKEITETNKPTILHFSGHGIDGGEGGLVLQNEEKNGYELLSPNANIAKNKIRMALLGLLSEIQEKFNTDTKVKEAVAIVDIKKIFRVDMPLWIFIAMFLGASAYVTTVPFKMLNDNPPKTVTASEQPIPDPKKSKDTKNHKTPPPIKMLNDNPPKTVTASEQPIPDPKKSKDTKNHKNPPPTTKSSKPVVDQPISQVPKDTSKEAKSSEGVIRDSSKSKPSIVNNNDAPVKHKTLQSFPVVIPAPLNEETVDKKRCYITTKRGASTTFHPKAAHTAAKKPLRELSGNKIYYVLETELRDLGTHRYLIKDDDGTEGWVYESGISTAPSCFSK